MSGRGRYRAGPWPGLSPTGGLVVLGCALLLAGGHLAVGGPHQLLPDVPLLGILAVVPMALATRIVRAPGVASAVCGAYLMPRALLSLLDPSIEPPPLLLVPAVAFDVSAWLRASDLAAVKPVTGAVSRGVTGMMTGVKGRLRDVGVRSTDAIAGAQHGRRGIGDGVTGAVTGGIRDGVTGAVTGLTADVTAGVTAGVTVRSYAGGGRRGLVGPRRCGRVRALLAGAIFGGVLVAVEPAFAVLLGADPSAWSGTRLWVTGGVTPLGCAVAGLIASTGRDG